MKNWVIPYELIIQKQFWGHLQKVDYLLNQMSYEKIQRGKKVPPWILPANLPLLEAPSLFLMKYEPRKQFDWLLFIFSSLHSQKGFWGFGVMFAGLLWVPKILKFHFLIPERPIFKIINPVLMIDQHSFSMIVYLAHV